MTDQTADIDAPAAKKKSKLPLILGLVLALAGGAGGFFAVQSDLLGLGGGSAQKAGQAIDQKETDEPLPDVTFVEVPPLVISLGPGARMQHLRFRAALEVPSVHAAEVTAVMPRVQDVLNSYLRALEPADLEAQGALIRLRGQMLRRVKIVVGEGRVANLLVLEFVLN